MSVIFIWVNVGAESMNGAILGGGGMSEEALSLLNDNLDMVRKNYILPC